MLIVYGVFAAIITIVELVSWINGSGDSKIIFICGTLTLLCAEVHNLKKRGE